MHVTRMHRDKDDRYIPGDCDHSLHAKDGMPICAACVKEFKQWKSLCDRLLSGACSRPDQLRSLSTTPGAQVQSEALMALAPFRAKVQGSHLPSRAWVASRPLQKGRSWYNDVPSAGSGRRIILRSRAICAKHTSKPGPETALPP